jgi:hypothetical protein
MAIKQYLDVVMTVSGIFPAGRKGIPDAITGLDLAIESLFPHTEFAG